jgi:YggT family protein
VTIFVNFVRVFTDIMIAAIFVRAILSWVITDPQNPLITVLDQITEPILGPLRRVVPRLGMFDITPMVAMIILIAIQQMVIKFYGS